MTRLLLLLLPLLTLVGCPRDPVIAIGGDDDDDPLPTEGEGEAGEGEGEGEGDGVECTDADLADAGDPDKPRAVLVGFPFGEVAGTDGTRVARLTLDGETLTDDGVDVDVATRPVRIAFVPSGALALVLGEDGAVVSVDVESMSEVGRVTLPIFGPNDLRVDATGTRAYVVDTDVTEATGVHVVTVGCDGALAVDAGARFGIRLAQSLAFLDGGRALLLGGQAVFDPVDDDDIRLLSLGATVSETASFDVLLDSIDTTRIGASADGSRVVVPNGSPFNDAAGYVVLLGVAGDVVSELDRVTGYAAASEALFSPDGDVALVSQWDEDRVVAFDVSAGSLTEVGAVGGVGLAEQMDVVTRGTGAGVVAVAAVNAVGNVHLLRIQGTTLTDLGSVETGGIPVQIAIEP